MGCSCQLLKKGCLELSLEIDNEISIEIGTGFNEYDGGYSSVGMRVSIDELSTIIDRLSSLKEKLLVSWKCKECGAINEQGHVTCDICASKKPTAE